MPAPLAQERQARLVRARSLLLVGGTTTTSRQARTCRSCVASVVGEAAETRDSLVASACEIRLGNGSSEHKNSSLADPDAGWCSAKLHPLRGGARATRDGGSGIDSDSDWLGQQRGPGDL